MKVNRLVGYVLLVAMTLLLGHQALCAERVTGAPTQLTIDIDANQLKTEAILAVNGKEYPMKSAIVSLTDEYYSGAIWALSIDLYYAPLTTSDLSDLLRGDHAPLQQRPDYDYNSASGAMIVFLDNQNRIGQVNVSLPGHACTVAWKPEDLARWMKGFTYNGTHITLRNIGSYRCGHETGMQEFTISWNINLDAPVFNRMKTQPQRNTDVPEPITAPQIVFGFPGYFVKQVIDAKTVGVQFGVPVTGVEADILTVNGSPATRVSRSESSEYIFSGYVPPPFGPVEIKLKPGGVRRQPGGTRFEGYTWSFQLLAPEEDLDVDGLTNAQEVEGRTDAARADTDGDGLPDAYEHSHSCLSPLIDEAHPLAYTNEPLPGETDADHDGLTNFEEYSRGTDPCSSKS